MADNLIPFDEPLPEPVITETRTLYTPPGGDGYWATLEARIMARVVNAAAALGWWQVLGTWARGGLVAAAAILTIVGVFLSRSTPEDMRIAYEAVMQPAPAESLLVPSEVLNEHYSTATRGATFRDALSY